MTTEVTYNVNPNDVEQHEGHVTGDASQAAGILSETSEHIHDGQERDIRVYHMVQPAKKNRIEYTVIT